MKIILDTNVIIAAFAARGLCSAVFELCLDRFDVVLSEDILQETSDHLQDKIKLSATGSAAVISYLRKNCAISAIDTVDTAICRDPNDLHILGLAQRSSADFIITGDKDLLALVEYKSTKIVAPREFWDAIKG